MYTVLVGVGLVVLAASAYWLGRLHAQWERDQEPSERPAGWAVEQFNSMCRLADAIERGEHEEGT